LLETVSQTNTFYEFFNFHATDACILLYLGKLLFRKTYTEQIFITFFFYPKPSMLSRLFPDLLTSSIDELYFRISKPDLSLYPSVVSYFATST